ncbi:hypothetical protein ACXR0O_26210 [Verrucomicrobiota bacterium sgz303538]
MNAPTSPLRTRGVLFTAIGFSIAVTIGCVIWIRREESDGGVVNTPISSPELRAAVPSDATTQARTRSVETEAIEESPSMDIPATSPLLELQPGKLAWEIQIDALLASQISDKSKAEELLKLLSRMPAEAHDRLVQEAVDRLADSDYGSVALPMLLNPGTDGAAEMVLYADLLQRPDEITLPALLALARTTSHPFSQSARETLALLVGNDFGTDWRRWESAVDGQLTRASVNP